MNQTAITVRTKDISPYLQSPISNDLEIFDGVFREIDHGSSDVMPPLKRIFKEYRPFPEKTVILGLCEDHLPLVLDLKNPRAGSILISGEPGSGKTNLIGTIARSASLIESPDSISYCVISTKPDELADLYNAPHCQALVAPYDRAAGEIILALSAIAEQRRSGRERGPALLLLIDDIYPLLTHYFDFNTFVHLKWLVQNGPRSQVWPVISIQTNNVWDLSRDFINIFPFRIVGHQNRLLTQGNQAFEDSYTRSNSTNYFNAIINRNSVMFKTFYDW